MALRQVTIDRETPLLLPPCLQDWLPENDIAHLILDAVELIGTNHYHVNHRGSGSEQYPPQMMLALLIYSYSHGITSSRKIERATYRDIAVRYITADTHPDHDTICAFRRQNGELIRECFIKVLKLARQIGLKTMGEVALDGTKMQANASRHKTTTYQKLQAEQKQLEQAIEELMGRAETQDQSEQNGKSQLPSELKNHQARLEKLRQAQKALQDQAKELAEERNKERENFDHKGPGEPPRPKSSEPQPGQTINLTDTEAPLMPQKQGGPQQPSYNAQIAVEACAKAPLILAADLSVEPNDRRQLLPMTKQTLAIQPNITAIHVDSGYDNTPQIYQLEQSHGLHIYCPPQTSKNGIEKDPNKKRKSSPQRTQDYRQGMRADMKTEKGRQSRGKRASSVEPVFHYIKNILGIRKFSLRGIAKAKSEWVLICLSFNLNLLQRLRIKGMVA